MKKITLCLAALTVLYFHSAILAPLPLLMGDPGKDTLSAYYSKAYGFGRLRSGELPLWNQYMQCGHPFHASPEAGIFYPLNLIFLFFHPARAMNFSYALHILLAGVGTALLLREFRLSTFSILVGAVSFMFSAPVICHILPGHLSKIHSLVWTGFIFWACWRLSLKPGAIRGLILGCFTALQLLGGDPQYCFYTQFLLLTGAVLLLAFYHRDDGTWRARARFLGFYSMATGLGVGLAAIQLFPTLELALHSVRQHTGPLLSVIYFFPLENLATLVFPEFFGATGGPMPYWGIYNCWEMCGYIGMVPLLFCFAALRHVPAAPQRRLLAITTALAAISLLLALGDATPLYAFLHTHVPGFELFRGCSKFIKIRQDTPLCERGGMAQTFLASFVGNPTMRGCVGSYGFAIAKQLPQ